MVHPAAVAVIALPLLEGWPSPPPSGDSDGAAGGRSAVVGAAQMNECSSPGGCADGSGRQVGVVMLDVSSSRSPVGVDATAAVLTQGLHRDSGRTRVSWLTVAFVERRGRAGMM